MTLGEAKKILNIDNIHAKEELLKVVINFT
jgi:hypothetical protein